MHTTITLRRGDPGYPRRLQSLEVGPEQLWLRGAWDANRPSVALVGARAASGVGQQLALALARDLSHAGVAVVSGGALGVDAAAHCGALLGPQPTCVVLGTGVDVVYPMRHAALFHRIVEGGGCLLSMFPLGTPPKAWHFPTRNRVIAALSDVIIVVESELGSGSRYTALCGRQLGKPVAVFRGSPGTEELLSEGAVALDPARGAADVLRLLRDAEPDRPTNREARTAVLDRAVPQQPWLPLVEMARPAAPRDELSTGPAWQVRTALSQSPCDLGELAVRTGLPVSDCAAVVVDLELQGMCTRLTGGRIAALEQVS